MALVSRNQLLAEVEALLEPHKGKRQLAPFPDSAAEFQNRYLKSKHGAWLLGYAGGRKLRGGEGERRRQFAVDVTVLSRKLASADGLLDDVALVEEALDGARFDLGTVPYEVEVVSDRFIDETDAVWHHVLRITAITL